ncbi:MAG: DUF4159 domain-containing protein [Methylobacteriaceae bacterium]|nr:DUF4159 domain-containing protein [Methylobacteriaceae bacterium]
MLGLPLAFTAPLALAALAILPVLYYLLRVTPPRPREVPFPPLKLILDLKSRQETPAHTPWWLLALRLAIAALIILTVAGPIWNPIAEGEGGSGPLLVVVDNGWAAAPNWERRLAAAGRRITTAGRKGHASAVVVASEGKSPVVLGDAAKTLERLNAVKPVPYLPDRMALLDPVRAFLDAHKDASIVWIADGLSGGGTEGFAAGLARAARDGAVTVIRDATPPRALAGPDNAPGALTVRVLRSESKGDAKGIARAVDLKGLTVGEAPFDFGAAMETSARFELPIELRNEIARIEIVNERSAGAVTLLDDRWKRRRVGIVSGGTADNSQPLLSPSYYLTRALAPFAEVREEPPGTTDPIASLLDDKVAMIILADVGIVAGPPHDRLERFLDDGGILLRFAGTRLAGASDDLVPVQLRRGGRTLGGALSWETPKRLAPFERLSPFFGLQPPAEVTVSRQVLAEPEPGLSGKTWAALADGTPLVTAQRHGKGYVVLVHVTADTTWSNLPLSGLFVDMLHRIVGLAEQNAVASPNTGAGGVGPGAQADVVDAIPPVHTLDGFGTLGSPPVTAKPITAQFSGIADADHPPGFYGTTDAFVAVNSLGPKDVLQPATYAGLNARTDELQTAGPIDLRPWLVAAAMTALLLDGIAWLWLSGGLSLPLRRVAAGAAIFALCAAGTLSPPPTRAAEAAPAALSKRDMESVLTTRLAYIVTGDAQTDNASRLGLIAISRALADRTSLTPADPIGVDPARDELTFYPLIYWPIVATQPQPAREAVLKIAAFMKDGGTIVFDTRDALTSRPNGPPTPEAAWLRQLLAGVDVPELEPVPRDHVITKTFYLIDGFVGRTTIGQTWIEALPPDEVSDPATRPARAGDGVSPIIITSNDLAGAWAVDRTGEPLYPLVPGGNRQRELALRGGINLVMYALTGNYKADQVHVKDLLERLGH